MTIHCFIADWSTHHQAINHIRQTVFIDEQHVPVELEWSENDPLYTYVLAQLDEQAIGTARINTEGHIGRMAVLSKYRQQGVGRIVLQHLLDFAKAQKIDSVYCHAQINAIPFYQKFGFEIISEPFLDAGIPHRTLRKYPL